MKRLTLASLTLLALAAGCGPRPEVPAEVAAPLKGDPKHVPAVVEGNNQFALALYGRLRAKDGNLFFSPFSVSAALAMTSAGARGETLDEMAKTLHLPEQEALHSGFGAVLNEVNGVGGKKRGYQLVSANALWGQRGHPFLPDFVRLNQDHYGAGLEQVDFKTDPDGARKAINAWVERRTHDKIQELLKPGLVRPDTRLVLTNAIYFKGDWARQFQKARTADGPFFLGGGKSVEVPLMSQRGEFRHLREKSVQVLEMPYAGGEVSMVVLLPKSADGLADLEKGLTAAKLSAWLRDLREQKVSVVLPKFQMTRAFALKPTLQEMGMRRAFGNAADLSGVDGTKDLFLAAVEHKAFVEVHEEGTEAAAATAVVGDAKGEVATPSFRADRPFVFLIRDTRSGSILFLGRLANPKG